MTLDEFTPQGPLENYARMYVNDRVDALFTKVRWFSSEDIRFSLLLDKMDSIEEQLNDGDNARLIFEWRDASISFAREIARDMYRYGILDGAAIQRKLLVDPLVDAKPTEE